MHKSGIGLKLKVDGTNVFGLGNLMEEGRLVNLYDRFKA